MAFKLLERHLTFALSILSAGGVLISYLYLYLNPKGLNSNNSIKAVSIFSFIAGSFLFLNMFNIFYAFVFKLFTRDLLTLLFKELITVFAIASVAIILVSNALIYNQNENMLPYNEHIYYGLNVGSSGYLLYYVLQTYFNIYRGF